MSPRKGPYAGPNHTFPIGNKVHARLAIGGATHSERVGNITPGEEATIKRKARAKLKLPAKTGGGLLKP